MSLKGLGAVIIWNDIAPEGRDEFYDWHINEHIPERVGVPGFLRGRRYIAADRVTSPEFLTLYETEDEGVLASAPYLERLNNPTEWTRRATSHFRNTSRCLTTIKAAKGTGIGRFMGTLRLPHTDEGLAVRDRLADRAGTFACNLPGGSVTGFAAGLANIDASNIKTAESKGRSDILQPPIGAVLLEGVTPGAINAAMDRIVAEIDPAHAAARGLYELEFSLDWPL